MTNSDHKQQNLDRFEDGTHSPGVRSETKEAGTLDDSLRAFEVVKNPDDNFRTRP